MSDDDAFIRAIIDAPDDDAPRLIYADWLDEREDPRGQYLRDEVQFARSAESAVREPNQHFDSVWAARVSRPPLGVCCHRIILFEHQPDLNRPSLTVQLLDRIESSLGITLPADYRAFMLNYNGGIPEPGLACPHNEWVAVGHFHTIWLEMDGANEYAEHDFLERQAQWADDAPRIDPRPQDLIEIAHSDFGDRPSLCQAWRGRSAGRVFLIDPTMESPEAVLEVADSLATFLDLFGRPTEHDDF